MCLYTPYTVCSVTLYHKFRITVHDFYCRVASQTGCRPPGFKVSASHTQARTRLVNSSRNTQHNRRISMPSVGFGQAIPATKRPQIYVVGHTATGIGFLTSHRIKNVLSTWTPTAKVTKLRDFWILKQLRQTSTKTHTLAEGIVMFTSNSDIVLHGVFATSVQNGRRRSGCIRPAAWWKLPASEKSHSFGTVPIVIHVDDTFDSVLGQESNPEVALPKSKDTLYSPV